MIDSQLGGYSAKLAIIISRDGNLNESKFRRSPILPFFDPKRHCSKKRSSDEILKIHQISKTLSQQFLTLARISQKDAFYMLLMHVLSGRFIDSCGRAGDWQSVHGRLLNNLGELAYRKIIQSKIAIKNAPRNHVYTYYIIFFATWYNGS